jgi:hypothetical protein
MDKTFYGLQLSQFIREIKSSGERLCPRHHYSLMIEEEHVSKRSHLPNLREWSPGKISTFLVSVKALSFVHVDIISHSTPRTSLLLMIFD